MADQNQFYQILNLLLSINNDHRTEAEVSEQITDQITFRLHQLLDSFVVYLCYNKAFLVDATCSVSSYTFEFERFEEGDDVTPNLESIPYD